VIRLDRNGRENAGSMVYQRKISKGLATKGISFLIPQIKCGKRKELVLYYYY